MSGLGLIWLLGQAWGAPVLSSAAPTEVTVYADQARVTRSAGVSLGSGRQAVRFVGLPVSVNAASVSAEVGAGAELQGVDLRLVPAAEAASERRKVLEAELEAKRDVLQGVQDGLSASRAALGVTQSSLQQSQVALNQQLLVGSRAPERARALRTSLGAAQGVELDALRAGDARVATLTREISALERERDTLGSAGTDTYEAVVHLEVSRAGSVKVGLNYTVSGASWLPRYDLRGEAATGKVAVALSAVVTQASGEDWSDVALSVSSARPGEGTEVPRLDPFFLTRPVRYAMPPQMRSKAAGGAPSAPAAMEVMEDSVAYAPMEQAVAEVQKALSATTFSVARPEDVPSDGTERKVLLTTANLDAELRHVLVPRLDLGAYIVGEATNTAGFPLLPGEAGVFLDGRFVGQVDFDVVAEGERFDLAFGLDERVLVKRVPTEVTLGKSVGASKKAVSTFAYRVSVENGHGRAIKLDVREQVPVSGLDDVVVALISSKAPPTELGEGLLRYDVSVPAQGKSQLQWGYTVTYPSDLSLGWME